MSILRVTVGSPELGPITLKFKVRDTAIARRWFAELLRKLQSPDPLGNAIFKGFAAAGRTPETCAEEMFKACDIIAAHDSQFLPTAYRNLEINGQNLILLHKSYELMRGEVIAKTEFMRSAPDRVQQAVEVLNERIHELEHLIYNKSPLGGIVKAVLKDASRTLFSEEDYEHFSFYRAFAAVTLRYCITGKTWIDTFYEKDDTVGEHNIRPLNQFNGEFDITFRESRYFASKEFQEPFREWLRARGKDPDDKSLGLGWLTVADWMPEAEIAAWDQKRICREVGLRTHLLAIEGSIS